MTREEAIEVLSQRPMIAPSKSNKQKMFEEALDMAIEALKAKTVEYETTVTINEPISIQSNYVYVVRCKDCRWYDKGENEVDVWEYCMKSKHNVQETDYCSFGELADKGGDAEMQTIAKTPDYMQQIPSEDGSDLISRAELLKTVQHPCNQDGEWSTEEIVAIIDIMPSAVCDDCIWHVCNYNKVDWDAPSAETVQGWRTGKPTEQGRYMVTVDAFGYKHNKGGENE